MQVTGGQPALRLMVRAVLRGDLWMRDAIWHDRRRLDDVAGAAQAGDRDALNALCLILSPYLKRIAACMGVAQRDIPDLVQDTLITAHLKLDRFDPARGSVQTWVTTILARLRLNLLRRRARRVRCLEALAGAAGRDRRRDGIWSAIGSSSNRDLLDQFASLSRRQRQVLTIYAIGGLSARETGRVLGMTAAGVRSIARDARNRLAQERER